MLSSLGGAGEILSCEGIPFHPPGAPFDEPEVAPVCPAILRNHGACAGRKFGRHRPYFGSNFHEAQTPTERSYPIRFISCRETARASTWRSHPTSQGAHLQQNSQELQLVRKNYRHH